MTIAAKLLTVNGIKTDIKTALESKGIDMTGVAFNQFANKIKDIPNPTGITFFVDRITSTGLYEADITPTYTTYVDAE